MLKSIQGIADEAFRFRGGPDSDNGLESAETQ
jgi:hypothetical protein